jgi:hypothetical protein
MTASFDLAAAIKAYSPSPVIVVPAGDYPVLTLKGYDFSAGPLRIVASGKVTYAGLTVTGCKGLTFEGVSILQSPVAQDVPALNVQDSSGIAFKGGSIKGTVDPKAGLYMGKGVLLTRCSHVSIVGAEVCGFFKGVSFVDSSDCDVTGCDIHTVRTSPVNGGGAINRISVAANSIHDIIPDLAHGDHSDGVHFFGKVSAGPMDGISVTDNIMAQAQADGTQGINLEGTAAAPFTNVKVTGNTLTWNNNQAIALNHVLSGVISGNVLRPAPGLNDPKHAPGIIVQNRVLGPPSDLQITGNTVKKIASFNPAYGTNTTLTDKQIAQYGAKA